MNSLSYLTSCAINEQVYLSCLMNNPEILKSENENRCSNKISIDLFNTLKKLQSQNIDFTVQTVTSETLKINPDVTLDIVKSIKELIESNKENFSFYKKRLIESYVKDEVQSNILKRLSTNLLSKGELDIPSLEDTITDLKWAINTVKDKNLQMKTMSDLADIYEQELLSRGTNGNFLPTGFTSLDKHLYGNGLMKGQMITIFGLSGVGKSVLSLNLISGQINRQVPCLYLPLEMGTIPTLDRLVAIRTGMTIEELTAICYETGTVSDYVLETFYREKKKLQKIKYFHLVDEANLTISDIHSLIKEAKRVNKLDELVVTVDLFTMLKDFTGEGKAQISEDAVNEYFDVLKEEQVAGINVVQARRKSDIMIDSIDDIKKYKPTVEMIKNSGAFYERSRIVLGVHRPKHYANLYLPDDPETLILDDIMEVAILKQNQGNLGEIKYLYTGECSKLYHYKEEKEDEEESDN